MAFCIMLSSELPPERNAVPGVERCRRAEGVGV